MSLQCCGSLVSSKGSRRSFRSVSLRFTSCAALSGALVSFGQAAPQVFEDNSGWRQSERTARRGALASGNVRARSSLDSNALCCSAGSRVQIQSVQCSAVQYAAAGAEPLFCCALLHCTAPSRTPLRVFGSLCAQLAVRCPAFGVQKTVVRSTVDCAVFSGRCGVQLLSCVLHTTHAVQNRTEQNKTRSEWRGAARRRTWRASGLNEQHGATNWPQRVHSSRHELINSLTLCEQRGGAFTSRAIIAPIIYLFCSLILFLFLFLFSTCLSTLRLAVVAP